MRFETDYGRGRSKGSLRSGGARSRGRPEGQIPHSLRAITITIGSSWDRPIQFSPNETCLSESRLSAWVYP